MISNVGLSDVEGFEFAGIDAGGIKNRIGLLYSKTGESFGVAVYTKSDVKAAPVILSMENDKKTNIKRAIVLNSGNANAFTGEKGLNDAKACAQKASEILDIKPEEVYVGSTGVIGREMELDIILDGIEKASKKLKKDQESAIDFVKAIMTTDTKVKQASTSFEIDGKVVKISSCVKGAGMLKPDMATMLCVITTDAKISPEMMSKALSDNVEDTFNCITIDGDTSTNDTIFLLSNGLAGNKCIDSEDENYNIFKNRLRELMEHMAKQVVNDGEGVTKFITLKVVNTPTKEKAKAVALSIGNSPLVKTTFYGEQLNWGRLVMAIGKAQTRLDCSIIDIYVNDFKLVENGAPAFTQEEYNNAEASLKDHNIEIYIDFKQGNEAITVWTCDYSLDYVKINSNYIS